MDDRFVLCNYAAFEIGRGLDFVDDFGALRDISVHLKSPFRLRFYLAGKDKLQGANQTELSKACAVRLIHQFRRSSIVAHSNGRRVSPVSGARIDDIS